MSEKPSLRITLRTSASNSSLPECLSALESNSLRKVSKVSSKSKPPAFAIASFLKDDSARGFAFPNSFQAHIAIFRQNPYRKQLSFAYRKAFSLSKETSLYNISRFSILTLCRKKYGE